MKSPGGSIFPYYYKGGEIHCLKYGSKHKNHDKLFELMKLEEAFIIQTNKRLKIWIDMYETAVTEKVIEKLIDNLKNLNDYIERLSFVGLSGINQWRLKRKIKQAGIIQNISFYADPEDAKTWLISEKRG
jgi:hypothetical protein